MQKFWLKFLLKRQRNRFVAGGVAIALILGIFFRFYNLDRKVFWGDEVFTAMRSSGYSVAEVVDRTYTGEVLTLADLQRYQHPIDRTWQDTWNALTTSPEQAPLYYLLARGWRQLWGDDLDVSPAGLARSIAAWRSLSAAVSLLAFPAVYWLCSELFASWATGWMAIALVAVSPFHVLFAQEARLYSLWTVTIALSSAALLRARRSSKGWWLYALTLALSLYTFLFSGFVAIAHGIYVLTLSGWRWSKTVAAYLGATAIGLLLFSPWMAVMLTRLEQLRSNVEHLDQTPVALPSRWMLNLSRLFFDFNHGPSWINPLTYGAIALGGYALFWIYRYRAKRIWLFIYTLIGVTGTALILADLLLGGQRSTIARYPIACYLGIQLATARLLAYKTLEWNWKKKWVIGLIALLLVALLSSAISSQRQLWWNKGLFKTKDNPAIAAVINQSDRPLVLSDSSIERILSLSYLLKPNTSFQLVDGAPPRVPPGYDLFLYQPSLRLRRQLGRQFDLQPPVVKTESLWKVTPREAQ